LAPSLYLVGLIVLGSILDLGISPNKSSHGYHQSSRCSYQRQTCRNWWIGRSTSHCWRLRDRLCTCL